VPQWLIDLFARYGYAAVFGGVFLENTGLPIPGETVLLAAAAIAHDGTLRLPLVILTAIAGATLGDNLGFFIGRRGGRRLAERYGARLGFTPRRLRQFDAFFARHGGRTVFFARFITGLRVVGAVLAGGSGMRWPAFLFYNACGAVTWCTVVAAVGYAFGHSWQLLEKWVGRTSLIALLAVAVAAALFLARGRWASSS
jgi:undecaprenyl-diphosphatase